MNCVQSLGSAIRMNRFINELRNLLSRTLSDFTVLLLFSTVLLRSDDFNRFASLHSISVLIVIESLVRALYDGYLSRTPAFMMVKLFDNFETKPC